MRRNGMTHLNNNPLCVVNCQTTGAVAGVHDLYQVCIMVLDAGLKPDRAIIPFYCDLQLKRPECIDEKVYKKRRVGICQAQVSGIEPYRAADLFEEWFGKLQLNFGKQIVPLSHDWPRDRAFILDWLGPETFSQFFSASYRDTQTTSLYCNDRAEFHNEPCPFAKNDIKWLGSVYKVDSDRSRDALQTCLLIAEVYRLMCKSN